MIPTLKNAADENSRLKHIICNNFVVPAKQLFQDLIFYRRRKRPAVQQMNSSY